MMQLVCVISPHDNGPCVQKLRQAQQILTEQITEIEQNPQLAHLRPLLHPRPDLGWIPAIIERAAPIPAHLEEHVRRVHMYA